MMSYVHSVLMRMAMLVTMFVFMRVVLVMCRRVAVVVLGRARFAA